MSPTKSVAATTQPAAAAAAASRLAAASARVCGAAGSLTRSLITYQAKRAAYPSCWALKCHISAGCFIPTPPSHSLGDEGISSARVRLLVCQQDYGDRAQIPQTEERRGAGIWNQMEIFII